MEEKTVDDYIYAQLWSVIQLRGCGGAFNLWRITITFGTGDIPGAGGSRVAEISF